MINTSRGKVVNEKDLARALRKKVIAGAGLDVFEAEPISAKYTLSKLENVVLAPHIGSSTKKLERKWLKLQSKISIWGSMGKTIFFSWLLILCVGFEDKVCSFYI